ncbi:MAG: DUF2284 domain-containing protein [Candidatus Aenigmarchaeota archaeon]|nr:DUF2284 domain-containing protein [Candidatus Aenigmarchaeota archaeon]
MKGHLDYSNKNGRKAVIEYCFDFIDTDKIPTNKTLFAEACKKGCKNYNKKWSCPPCSPSFDKMKHKKKFLVVMIKINGRYFADCTEWMKVKTINSILKSKLDNAVRGIADKFNGYCYISGSCRLCKICAKKTNKPCRHPNKLRYSLEAVGIDCNKLVEKTLKEKLCWYNKGVKYEYGSAVGAVELNDKVKSDDINDVIIGSLKG